MKMRLRSRAIDKVYKRRHRYEIPEWQREPVWGKEKKKKLIDSVLRGWKLPKFYFLKTASNPEEFEVLDGQQRLSALFEFFENNLALSDKTAKEFGGSFYKDLPDGISDAFDDYEIDFDEITHASEQDQKEFFQRLQEGLPLTSSEKLNSVHSKLRNFCMDKLSKHEFFSNTCSVSSKRYAFFDIAAKVMALEIEGIDSGTRYEDVQTVFLDNDSFSGNSAAAKRVKQALDILKSNLPGPMKKLRNRTLVQSMISLTCHLQKAGLVEKQKAKLGKFIEHFLVELNRQVELGQEATDQDYVAFQRTINANVRSGAKTRNDILLKKLFQFSPEFYTDFLQNKSLSTGLKDQIESLAVQIRKHVTVLNEHYSGIHGKDLFKPTNKTIKALTITISNPTTDFDQYKELVEDLYFLFRESLGQRLDGILPESFVDVNDLRTLNEHDVDHGKASKVAKQRKALAMVFAKYSGELSPLSLEPGRFLVIQSNLLAALEADLQRLVKEGFASD